MQALLILVRPRVSKARAKPYGEALPSIRVVPRRRVALPISIRREAAVPIPCARNVPSAS